MMRIVEVLLSIPYLLTVILISVVTDSKSIGTMMLALVLTWMVRHRASGPRPDAAVKIPGVHPGGKRAGRFPN